MNNANCHQKRTKHSTLRDLHTQVMLYYEDGQGISITRGKGLKIY